MFRTGDGDGTAITRSQSSRLWTLWLAARVETLHGPGSGPSGAVPRLKLCQMNPFLSPHSILAMLPAAMAKSVIHRIVHFMSQICPIRSLLCHASHRAFTNKFAATQHKAPFPLLETN